MDTTSLIEIIIKLLDVLSAIKKKLKNPLFPYTLRGKKLKKTLSFSDADYEICLDKYLQTENLEDLYHAIQANNCLLQDAGIDLELEERLTKQPSPEYIDSYTIVGESVRHLDDIILFAIGGKERIKEAKKYLTKLVGSASIPPSSEVCYHDDIGLIHVTQSVKRRKPRLTYESAQDFIKYWDRIYNSFEEGMKGRYPTITEPLIKEMRGRGNTVRALAIRVYQNKPKFDDAQKVIENNGDQISQEDLKRLVLEDTSTQTGSYIAWKHEKQCLVCKKKENRKKVGYRTVLNLYKKAEAEINSFNSQQQEN